MKAIKPPTLAEVIQLRERAPGSLESAAASINRHIDLFLRADVGQQAHRVRAGHELIAVRKRIPEGEWEAWCADNIHRSYRDIQKLMAMAGSENPEAIAVKEQFETRERMRAQRAAHVRHPVERLFQLFLRLNGDQRAEFLALVEKEMEV